MTSTTSTVRESRDYLPGDMVAWVGGRYAGEYGTVQDAEPGGYIRVIFTRWPDTPMLVARQEIRPV